MEKISEKLLLTYLGDLFVEKMICRSYREFANEFLGKSAPFYTLGKIEGRDMNSDAAINLLTKIRKQLRTYKSMQRSIGPINDERIEILTEAEILVKDYLRDKFRIKEIVEIDDISTVKTSGKKSAIPDDIQDKTIVKDSVKKRKKDDDDDYEGYYGAIVF